MLYLEERHTYVRDHYFLDGKNLCCFLSSSSVVPYPVSASSRWRGFWSGRGFPDAWSSPGSISGPEVKQNGHGKLVLSFVATPLKYRHKVPGDKTQISQLGICMSRYIHTRLRCVFFRRRSDRICIAQFLIFRACRYKNALKISTF